MASHVGGCILAHAIGRLFVWVGTGRFVIYFSLRKMIQCIFEKHVFWTRPVFKQCQTVPFSCRPSRYKWADVCGSAFPLLVSVAFATGVKVFEDFEGFLRNCLHSAARQSHWQHMVGAAKPPATEINACNYSDEFEKEIVGR